VSGRYTVEFERSAKKEFDRLDGPIRARVLRKVAALEDDPRLWPDVWCEHVGVVAGEHVLVM
jgi:mRNA-degrading endonuclease RelE of RelBE toxin-antitoxin system